ncbi:hypothetical protein JTE90_006165, partial [Oedothorax gibbosus]
MSEELSSNKNRPLKRPNPEDLDFCAIDSAGCSRLTAWRSKSKQKTVLTTAIDVFKSDVVGSSSVLENKNKGKLVEANISIFSNPAPSGAHFGLLCNRLPLTCGYYSTSQEQSDDDIEADTDLQGNDVFNSEEDEVLGEEDKDLGEEEFSSQENDFSSQENDIPLYSGSPITVIESVILVLVFFLKHSLTSACLSDLLTLIKMHCTLPNFCPKSVYLFKKFLACQQKVDNIYYCSTCYTTHKNAYSVCPQCKSVQLKDCNFINQLSASNQLKSILERPGVLHSINDNKVKHVCNSGKICDLYDGRVYKKFKEEHGNDNNLTFMWFTDGAALFKSSNVSIWPLYLAINELPFVQRFKPQNLILVALWVGERKPDMNLFFRCCDNFLNDVGKGLSVVVNGVSHFVKEHILCGTCDLPAKCSILNMIQFNGSYGCAKCLQKGETYKEQGATKARCGRVQVYPFEETIDKPHRTHMATMNHAKEACNKKSVVFGIKGPSQLSLYVPDIIRSTGLDYMHGVCLGVMKKVLSLFLDPTYSKSDFSLLKFRTLIDQSIQSISVPHMFQRVPRSVNLIKNWKASEFKNFLLYFSVPVFRPILNGTYFEHHMLLVYGISILLKENISHSELVLAEHALWHYVYLFQQLYGKRHMSANVHNLLHLADSVRDLGPLWASSCFGWESVNGFLIKCVHGTQYVQTQINAAISTHICLPLWIAKLSHPNMQLFCANIMKSVRYK